SHMLQDIEIKECDFEQTVQGAKKGDFVYFDPPYFPLSRTAHFTAYDSHGFPFDAQARLAKVSKALVKRGVAVMLSNSCTPEIQGLYRGFHQEVIPAARAINSKGDRRREIPELIITGYMPDQSGNEGGSVPL
ncbi:MAG: DNA adenine methylase, partial [Methanomicrobiales archaeon]|nr:DNA adenine methylase [Methanomicrobiales archaeon]